MFREYGVAVPNKLLAPLQESIDEKLYGDLLRGFWTKDYNLISAHYSVKLPA
ncbi:hypothetical protein KHM19_10460 [Leptospira borgpetersenii]|nr:hypothetical protein KHM19_10460 [Leptospira borgpetersenii]GIM25339.1 hypothetical protein KHM25_12640 [Leptospira borgpetersenii]